MFRRLFKNGAFPVELNTHPFSDLPLLLISGVGRSGTTVLRKSIGAHRGIQSLDRECNIIHDLSMLARNNLEDEHRRLNLAVSVDEYWSLFRQMILHLHWPIDKIDPNDSPAAISTYSQITPAGAKGIQNIFPRHVICFIIRNGIEVVSSHMLHEAFRNKDFSDICRTWAHHTNMLNYARNHGRFFLFRHEWFHDRETARQGLEQAFASIGLPPDEDCIDVAMRKTIHPTKFPGESAEMARDRTMRKERWRLWTDEQRDTFATVCGAAMERLEYPIPWKSRQADSQP